MTAAIRLGTRASVLATTQSGHVAEALRGVTGREVELVPITTAGDVLTGPLAQLGGTGVFVAALREALLRDECDIVVHSMKDLPTGPVEGLRIGAVPVRESQRDALCARDGHTLASLPHGSVVGSGSPRRAAQLLRRRPDLVVRGIRGNVDTRLRKVDDGEYDATVLAEAGLSRLGRTAEITDLFDLAAWPTSAGQGALAVEVRTGSVELFDALAAVGDTASTTSSLLERAVLRRLEAGCAAPVGISATLNDAEVELIAEVYALDGSRSVRVTRRLATVEVADESGRTEAARSVVAELLDGGAAALADLAGTGR